MPTRLNRARKGPVFSAARGGDRFYGVAAANQWSVFFTSGCGTVSHRLASPQNTILPRPTGRTPSTAGAEGSPGSCTPLLLRSRKLAAESLPTILAPGGNAVTPLPV